MNLSKQDIEFLISCACRYNIGRASYSPHMFIEIVERNIEELSPICRQWIIDDIERNKNSLGMDFDAKRWLELYQKLKSKERTQV